MVMGSCRAWFQEGRIQRNEVHSVGKELQNTGILGLLHFVLGKKPLYFYMRAFTGQWFTKHKRPIEMQTYFLMLYFIPINTYTNKVYVNSTYRYAVFLFLCQ